MLGAFVVTWLFLLFIDATSPPVRTTSEVLPNGGEATSRAGGEGGEVTKQPGALTRDEARGGRADGDDALLTTALGDWAAATNNRDIGKLMGFYSPELSTFYKLRKASSSTVRREKLRLFAEGQILNIRVSELAIKYSGKPPKATVRFRKNYTTGGRQTRPAGVIQELVWQKTSDGWKIVSERDVQIIK
jgi:ketosteroid isomerase-like protein